MLKKKKSEVQCNNCARRCGISLNEVGYCGVRLNDCGNLKLLNYGKFIFLKKDKGNLLVGSLGSNMRFSFDMNWDTSLFPYLQAKEIGREKTNKLLQEIGYSFMPEELASYAKKLGCRKIVFQYNEPLIYMEYILDVVKKDMVEVGIVSNGYFTDLFFNELFKKVSSIDILFFSTFDKFYFKHSRAQLSIVKEGITKLYEGGFDFRIVYPLIEDENDSEEDVESLCRFLLSFSKDLSLVFEKYYPSYRMVDKGITTHDVLNRSRDIALKLGMQNVILNE